MKKLAMLLVILASLCGLAGALEYDNPFDFKTYDGNLFVSFKGAFREQDYIAFCFVLDSKLDMFIDVDESEVFDSKGTEFKDDRYWIIGRERTREREILARLPIKAECWVKIPASESEILPVIERVSFKFGGKWHQYRNITVKEWREWELIRRGTGID